MQLLPFGRDCAGVKGQQLDQTQGRPGWTRSDGFFLRAARAMDASVGSTAKIPPPTMSATLPPHLHFLMVSLAAQGQINPIRNLARRLATLAGARVTIATPLSSHRRLFPASTTDAGQPDDATQELPLNPDGSGIISYAPYSDGFDAGFDFQAGPVDLFVTHLKSVGYRTLSALAQALAAAGRPVTCVVYTMTITCAVDLARDLNVPSVLYWTQAAAIFAICYHNFRHRPDLKSSKFTEVIPGLPRLRAEEFPTLIAESNPTRLPIEEIFAEVGKSAGEKQRVLVNTFRELEAAVMEGEKGSVVYVAFGSITRPAARQVEEISRGLKDSGRPYLWVQRKDGGSRAAVAEEGQGMLVEWCRQVKVLSHGAVGCFVTHCGWNSMTEAIMSGVPMVLLPDRIDQPTNAALAEMVWGIGVRPKAGEDGVVSAAELQRCIGMVMGEGETGMEVRKCAAKWKEKAAEAVANDDGPRRPAQAPTTVRSGEHLAGGPAAGDGRERPRKPACVGLACMQCMEKKTQPPLDVL
ncbi:Cyanidin 3-O-rutinoside 5-O-glucosyltransferase [Platanthera zijinensis]|uniref:Glycosyltransferase n=1 Tax=Platanthera zijinensis TaxID=2320716 RepID=A0AAP0BAW3_9ASPA